MRIAIDHQASMDDGGAFSAYANIYETLCEICEEFGWSLDHYKLADYRSTTINRLIENFLYKTNLYLLFDSLQLKLSRFEKILQESDIDLVMYLNPHNNSEKLNQIPYVNTVWDLGHRDLKMYPEYSSRLLVKRREKSIHESCINSIFILVESEETKKRLILEYGIPNQKIFIINLLPSPKFSSLTLERKQLIQGYAIYPANFWPHKNHLILLLALKHLISKDVKSRKLIFTGADKGNLNFIMNKIRELELEEFVEVRGVVSQDDLKNLYFNADLTLYPSLLGPTNLPPFESLSLGTPVVTTNINFNNIQGQIKGLYKIDNSSDFKKWAKYLDIGFKPKKPDINEVQKIITKQNDSNKKHLKELLFKFVKAKELCQDKV